MGCDIHFRLERRTFHLDQATSRTRLVALILAKRASSGGGQTARGRWDLASDLWARVAQMCPVTYQTVWVGCPFAEWLTIDKKSFRGDVLRAESAGAEIRAELQKDVEGVDDYCDSEIQEEITSRVQNEFELTDVSSKFGCLCRRNYNAFGLFSPGPCRSQNVKQLGCMREGWPKNRSPLLSFEDDWMGEDNPNHHSHCFTTLEALFAVDWDIDSTSEERSGFHLRPKGPVDFVPDATIIQASLQKMLESEDGKDEQVRAQLIRGAEARIQELHSDEGTTKREDLHAFDAFGRDQQAMFWKKLMGGASGLELSLPPAPPKTRGEVLDWAWDQHSNAVEQLKALEALITTAENDPADFRLLVAFDN